MNQSKLPRGAAWSGAATIGIPVAWGALVTGLGGNAGLAVGWMGVLPVLIFVPLGALVTIGFLLAAAAYSNSNEKRSDVDEIKNSTTHDPR